MSRGAKQTINFQECEFFGAEIARFSFFVLHTPKHKYICCSTFLDFYFIILYLALVGSEEQE